MKKTLLTLVLIVSSSFFVYAAVNGSVTGVIDGVRVSGNSQTGVVQVGGNGVGVQVNTQTGQIGGSGGFSIGGINISGIFGGGAGGVGSTYVQKPGLLGLLGLAQETVRRLVPFLIGVALLAFMWFLVEFIWKGREDATAKTRSAKGMAWAVFALFVMVSIWGIIALMGGIFGINQGGNMSGFKLPGEQ